MAASRYDGLEVATLGVPDGAGGQVDVRYLRRRFLPRTDPAASPLAYHRVRRDDRLDLISQTYLGDPTVFWMVADANPVLAPDDLTAPDAEDSVLVIPLPGH
ncbi:LysM domain-containing protein [Actinopolymorpha rutila]|uniref:LysM domain-containing protein n=1 Tax=Actinopolymorpha rutila TaxID=446787 RepID=A0A852ZCE6_9ACTN|nr:LysM domain-containing protein [Actinopolymorpha rutila]NYH90817.1 hypothetical protein [Actinopolymorpha rutila]